MTIGEICRSYKEAKFKGAQITILADLNVTSTVEIRRILEAAGLITPRKRKTRIYAGAYTAEDEARVKSIIDDGGTVADAAKALNRSYPSVRGLTLRNGWINPMIEKGRVEFSQAEIEVLRIMRINGNSWGAIGRAMGRNPSSCEKKWKKLYGGNTQ